MKFPGIREPVFPVPGAQCPLIPRTSWALLQWAGDFLACEWARLEGAPWLGIKKLVRGYKKDIFGKTETGVCS